MSFFRKACLSTAFYGDDIGQPTSLQFEQGMLQSICKQRQVTLRTFGDVVEFLKGADGVRAILPLTILLVRQCLTIPVTSATAERSFSTLRRLKTYLRATMGQERLNHLALCNVYREDLYDLDLAHVVDSFICQHSLRRSTFALAKDMQ